MAVVPLFNLPSVHPDWLHWQRYYLDHPESYPLDGNAPLVQAGTRFTTFRLFSGRFARLAEQTYQLTLITPMFLEGETFDLVTLDAVVDQQLQQYQTGEVLQVAGRLNRAGNWLLATEIDMQAVDLKLM
jgi:hypothetical protein